MPTVTETLTFHGIAYVPSPVGGSADWIGYDPTVAHSATRYLDARFASTANIQRPALPEHYAAHMTTGNSFPLPATKTLSDITTPGVPVFSISDIDILSVSPVREIGRSTTPSAVFTESGANPYFPFSSSGGIEIHLEIDIEVRRSEYALHNQSAYFDSAFYYHYPQTAYDLVFNIFNTFYTVSFFYSHRGEYPRRYMSHLPVVTADRAVLRRRNFWFELQCFGRRIRVIWRFNPSYRVSGYYQQIPDPVESVVFTISPYIKIPSGKPQAPIVVDADLTPALDEAQGEFWFDMPHYAPGLFVGLDAIAVTTEGSVYRTGSLVTSPGDTAWVGIVPADEAAISTISSGAAPVRTGNTGVNITLQEPDTSGYTLATIWTQVGLRSNRNGATSQTYGSFFSFFSDGIGSDGEAEFSLVLASPINTSALALGQVVDKRGSIVTPAIGGVASSYYHQESGVKGPAQSSQAGVVIETLSSPVDKAITSTYTGKLVYKSSLIGNGNTQITVVNTMPLPFSAPSLLCEDRLGGSRLWITDGSSFAYYSEDCGNTWAAWPLTNPFSGYSLWQPNAIQFHTNEGLIPLGAAFISNSPEVWGAIALIVPAWETLTAMGVGATDSITRTGLLDSGLAPDPPRLMFSSSFDAGVTWAPPVEVAVLEPNDATWDFRLISNQIRGLSRLVIVGGDSPLFHSDDTGATWTPAGA